MAMIERQESFVDRVRTAADDVRTLCGDVERLAHDLTGSWGDAEDADAVRDYGSSRGVFRAVSDDAEDILSMVTRAREALRRIDAMLPLRSVTGDPTVKPPHSPLGKSYI